jgi:hypothetical protein
MCRIERWSVRTLRAKIHGLLFERTALSHKPAELARQERTALRNEDRLTPDQLPVASILGRSVGNGVRAVPDRIVISLVPFSRVE